MNCKHCGGTLSLEAEYCPHCGQINVHGQQHARDMKYYRNDYEESKKEIYVSTKIYSQLTVRFIIIAILVVLIGTAWGVIASSYNAKLLFSQTMIGFQEKDFKGQLDKYLEEEDYFAFNDMVHKHGLAEYTFTVYPFPQEYIEYYDYIRMCCRYCDIITNGLIVLEYEKPQYSEFYLDNMAESIQRLYEYEQFHMDDLYQTDSEEFIQYNQTVQDMKEKVSLFLQEYFYLTEEDATAIEDGASYEMIRRMICERWQHE